MEMGIEMEMEMEMASNSFISMSQIFGRWFPSRIATARYFRDISKIQLTMDLGEKRGS